MLSGQIALISNSYVPKMTYNKEKISLVSIFVVNVIVLIFLLEYLYSYWILIVPGLVFLDTILMCTLIKLNVKFKTESEPTTMVALSFFAVLVTIFYLSMFYVIIVIILSVIAPELKDSFIEWWTKTL